MLEGQRAAATNHSGANKVCHGKAEVTRSMIFGGGVRDSREISVLDLPRQKTYQSFPCGRFTKCFRRRSTTSHYYGALSTSYAEKISPTIRLCPTVVQYALGQVAQAAARACVMCRNLVLIHDAGIPLMSTPYEYWEKYYSQSRCESLDTT